jgi:hypothetical protein
MAGETRPHLTGHACCKVLVFWPDNSGSFRLSAKHTSRKAASAVTPRIVLALSLVDRACLRSELNNTLVSTSTRTCSACAAEQLYAST